MLGFDIRGRATSIVIQTNNCYIYRLNRSDRIDNDLSLVVVKNVGYLLIPFIMFRLLRPWNINKMNQYRFIFTDTGFALIETYRTGGWLDDIIRGNIYDSPSIILCIEPLLNLALSFFQCVSYRNLWDTDTNVVDSAIFKLALSNAQRNIYY